MARRRRSKSKRDLVKKVGIGVGPGSDSRAAATGFATKGHAFIPGSSRTNIMNVASAVPDQRELVGAAGAAEEFAARNSVPRPVPTIGASAGPITGSIPRIATDIKVIRPTPENPTGKNLSGREMLRRKLFLSGSGTGSSVKDKELRAQIASEQARADQIAYKEAAQKESDDEKAFIASESTKEIAGRSDVANINAGGKLGVAEADRIAKNEVVDKQIQAKSDELVAQGLAIGTPQFNERLKAEFNEKRKLAAAANDYAQELEAFRSLNRIAEKSLTTVEEFSIDDDGEKTTTTITPGVVTPSAESSVGDEGGPSPDTDGDGMLNAEERATRDAEVQFINQAILNGIDGNPLNESETKRAMARLAVLRKLK